MNRVRPMTSLTIFLASRVRQSGIPQTELARRTGFSQKHVCQMLTRGEGATDAWDALLRAAGINLFNGGPS